MSNNRVFKVFFSLIVLSFVFGTWQAQARPSFPAGDLLVYGDALAAGWQNWSWSSTVDFNATSQVYNGSKAIAVTYTEGWGGFSLRISPAINTVDYTQLSFWLRSGSGTLPLSVYLQSTDGGGNSPAVNLTATTTWTQHNLPLISFGSPAQIARINIQENSGNPGGTIYLDELLLVGAAAPPPNPLNLAVDVSQQRWAISPYIYGIQYAKESFADEIDLPLRRWGGNAWSRYNFQNNTSNLGSDYFYINVTNWDHISGNVETYADWVDENLRTGAASLLTMPIMGYVAKDNTSCGYSIDKYGAQTDADPFRPDCGNGIKQSDGKPVTGDPLDTSVAAGPQYVSNWMDALVGQYGTASQGGVRFFNLDNEPELWSETHRDAHPEPQSYEELKQKSVSAATALKTVDPSAQVLGFVSFGWNGYWYSRKDAVAAAANGYTYFPDYATHGNRYQVEYFLDELKAASELAGVRLLDYLDLHFYPQNGVDLSLAGDAANQALRLRSTRALWDPGYRDESWIGADSQPVDMRYVRLLPRMHNWVDTRYPGTKLAITEYNWGGLEHINGALAQAEILGIFADQRLDLGVLFNYPDPNLGYDHFETLPGAYVFRLFRTYDGAGAKYGDTHVQASSSDRHQLSVFAAQRASDGALTVLVINKTAGSLSAPLSLAGITPGASAQRYQYSDANLTAIQHLADVPLGGGAISLDYPANSLTLLVIPNNVLLTNRVYLPLLSR